MLAQVHEQAPERARELVQEQVLEWVQVPVPEQELAQAAEPEGLEPEQEQAVPLAAPLAAARPAVLQGEEERQFVRRSGASQAPQSGVNRH